MEESILNTIKPLLNVEIDDESFDNELIPLINTSLATLVSLGVGPKDGFVITGPNEVWSEFAEQRALLAGIVTYVHLNVRLIFDPPTSSAVISAYQRTISELEFRLPVIVETDINVKEGG